MRDSSERYESASLRRTSSIAFQMTSRRYIDSGAPGRWPDATKFNYLLIPYPTRFGFDYTHIELQVASEDPQFRYSRGRYDAYHLANVDGYTVGVFFDQRLIDAPVIKSTMC